ncbi:MAG: hypothetical protein KBA91_04190, partial [Candidatus Moranbacteria bacterium]|nr:hypothetical protein [Candidatus Moranbacteria bacterium]
MKDFLRTLILHIEQAPLTFATFLTSFLALMFVRLTIEGSLEWFHEESFSFFFFELAHTLLFFLCSFLIILPIVRFAGARTIENAINFLLFGFLIMLTPPFIDRYIFGAGNYWSFYAFDGLFGLVQRFFTLFGDSPAIGITYGVRFEVVVATIIIGLYGYFKTKRLRTALLSALFVYSALFIMGTFPSWVTLIVFSFQKGLLAIQGTDVAALFLAPEHLLGRNLTDFRTVLAVKGSLVYALLVTPLLVHLLYRTYPAIWWALIRNARVPQLFYHAGLLCLGILFASHFA